MAEAVGSTPISTLAKPVARRAWSAATIVVALAMGLILVIFGVFAFLCWQAFGTALDNAKAKAQTAAEIVAGDVRWTLGAARIGLQTTAALGTGALDPAVQPQVQATLETLPVEVTLGVYDGDGNLKWHTGTLEMPPSISDPALLADIRDGGKDWVIPPVETDTSKLTIVQRLRGDGLPGIVMLAVPADLLRTFWEPQKLGPDSSVVLNRLDGWLVGRYPPLAGPINASKTSAAWPQVTNNENGTYVATSPIDGITRVVGFRHIPELGLVAFATVSQVATYGQIWTSIFIVLGLLVPIAVMLMVFALIISRMLRTSARINSNLTAALEHNELLFREIHHRVKNNLQSVSSLLQMQPIPREIKADMGQRIAAMSAVHEHIYRSGNFGQVRVKDYLETLAENIRAGASKAVELELNIEDIAVDKDAAAPLGLIVNEVVANAVKHAFSDGREGRVTVQLKQVGDTKGELCVEDNGVGFDPEAPTKGIGRRLIAALTAQLNGQSSFTAAAGGGSRFTLTFPLGS